MQSNKQGIVLGTTLFLMYKNLISELNLCGSLYIIAEDIILTDFPQNSHITDNSILKEMKEIFSQLESNKLHNCNC